MCGLKTLCNYGISQSEFYLKEYSFVTCDLRFWLNICKGKQVLDLCSGPGRVAISIVQYVNELLSIDLNSDYVRYLNSEFAKMGIDYASAVCSDLGSNIEMQRTFSCAIMPMNSFSILMDEKAVHNFLHFLTSVLIVGGEFYFDIISPDPEWFGGKIDNAPNIFTVNNVRIERYCTMKCDFWDSTYQFNFTYYAYKEGLLIANWKRVAIHRFYTINELINLLSNYGLKYRNKIINYSVESKSDNSRICVLKFVKEKGEDYALCD